MVESIGKKEYSKSCNSSNIYKNYFTMINGLLNLTNKEIDIVSKLYYYDHEISSSVDNDKLRGVLLFSKQYKSKIIKELDIKPLLFNNYISSLKNKSIILVDKENSSFKWLNPKFVLPVDEDIVQIVFNLKIEKEAKVEKVDEIVAEAISIEETKVEEAPVNYKYDPSDPWSALDDEKAREE